MLQCVAITIQAVTHPHTAKRCAAACELGSRVQRAGITLHASQPRGSAPAARVANHTWQALSLTGRSRPFIFLYCPHALHSVACVSGSRRQLLVRDVPQLAQHLAPAEIWLPPAVPAVPAVPWLVVGPLRAGPPLRGALRGWLPLRMGPLGGSCCVLSAGADTARPPPRPSAPSSPPTDRREAEGGRSMLGDSGLLSLQGRCRLGVSRVGASK